MEANEELAELYAQLRIGRVTPDDFFARVYDLLWDSLVRSIIFLGRFTLEDAEDLAQRIIIMLADAVRDDRDFDGHHIASWVFRTARWRMIDQLRQRRWVRHVVLEDLPVTPGFDDPFLIRRMRAAIMQLPELQKKVIVLRYYGGLRIEEIADLIKKPTSTVNRALRRARLKLIQAPEILAMIEKGAT